MYTLHEFTSIRTTLRLAKDKGKYLESFGIPLLAGTFVLHDKSDKFEESFTEWKDKEISGYKTQLDKEYFAKLQVELGEHTKKKADLDARIESNRKRRREYE
jgi:hypothetical protein